MNLAVGFVGDSDLIKISEQLSFTNVLRFKDFDFAFAENILMTYGLERELLN